MMLLKLMMMEGNMKDGHQDLTNGSLNGVLKFPNFTHMLNLRLEEEIDFMKKL